MRASWRESGMWTRRRCVGRMVMVVSDDMAAGEMSVGGRGSAGEEGSGEGGLPGGACGRPWRRVRAGAVAVVLLATASELKAELLLGLKVPSSDGVRASAGLARCEAGRRQAEVVAREGCCTGGRVCAVVAPARERERALGRTARGVPRTLRDLSSPRPCADQFYQAHCSTSSLRRPDERAANERRPILRSAGRGTRLPAGGGEGRGEGVARPLLPTAPSTAQLLVAPTSHTRTHTHRTAPPTRTAPRHAVGTQEPEGRRLALAQGRL